MTDPLKTRTPADGLPVVVVGAGPAGLTAALELAERGTRVLVVEANDRVGGLARTVEYKGFRFDIGGHRFFTKVPAIRERWRSMLGPDFLRRPRLSRIFFDGQFFDYPLKPLGTLRKLGVLRSAAILASYLRSIVRPIRPELTFEAWVINRFGRRLYRTFFKAYTEKVWGIPCSTISARWAAQRIQDLSVRTALTNMLPRALTRSRGIVKTLIEEFEYPRLGPGMMWTAFADRIEQLGGTVLLNARVRELQHDAGDIHSVVIEQGGQLTLAPVRDVISTMALTDLIGTLSPAVPSPVRQATGGLKYRDFITVAVIVDRPSLFPDNWLYIHEPAVKVGRIQNFKNWSLDMVPDQSQTCLGLEYFCTEGDGLWSLSDAQLVELAKRELAVIGLAGAASVVDAAVVRVPKAYPIYDADYEQAVAGVRDYLTGFGNLQTIGRNGTHTYNNQDHSMVMGMLAVRNLFGERHDLWGLGSEDEYLEEVCDERNRSLQADIRTVVASQPVSPKLMRRAEVFEQH